MTTLVPATDPHSLELVAEALAAGSVVAIPTDTVYGLAASLGRPDAVGLLFELKDRPPDVPLAVLVAGLDQLGPITCPLGEVASWLAARYWPGPLTLVVERRAGFDADLGGSPLARRSVGVRWPAAGVVGELARAVGPVVATSANRHGDQPARTAEEVGRSFEDDARLAIVLDGGECSGIPSTVVDCTGETLRCVREGAVDWAEVLEHLESGPITGGRQ